MDNYNRKLEFSLLPYDMTDSFLATYSYTLPIFNRVQRPDIVSGANPTTELTNGDFNPYADRHINPAAFATPAAYRFGTAPPAIGNLWTFRHRR